MGVANGRGYQEVGVASGWNLWVWLVSVVVRRYIIDILIIASGASFLVCSIARAVYIYIYTRSTYTHHASRQIYMGKTA